MNQLHQILKKLTSNTLVLALGVTVIAAVIGFVGVKSLTGSKALVSGKSCSGLCVNITKDGMDPDTLTVKVGEYVQFNSADGQQHNIGLGAGKEAKSADQEHEAHESHEHKGDFVSGDFSADEAWRVQFKKAGTYKFHDHYNPNLNILVVVYQPGADTSIR